MAGKEGKKTLFVYIWFSGADCEPLAGRGDVTGSGESGNGSSPLIGRRWLLPRYLYTQRTWLLSACTTTSFWAEPAWWTAGVTLQISSDLPAQFELRPICSTRLFCDSRDIWPSISYFTAAQEALLAAMSNHHYRGEREAKATCWVLPTTPPPHPQSPPLSLTAHML